MARPKATETPAPERMQEAFWRLLERKPYAQITISDITRESGLNRSAFYYHYTNIPELADDAIAAIYERPEVAAFIAHIIRRDSDIGTMREYAMRYVADASSRTSLHRLSLIVGSHGSAGLTAQLKGYLRTIWLSIIGVDPERLDTGQLIVIEFVSSGIIGLIGRAPTLFTPEGIDALACSALPDMVSQLISSLRKDNTD